MIALFLMRFNAAAEPNKITRYPHSTALDLRINHRGHL